MFKVLVLFSLMSSVLSLRCYDCDPTSKNQCRTPEQDQIKETTCTFDAVQAGRKGFLQMTGNNNNDFECFSIYYKDKSDKKTGIYRGCTLKITSGSCGISVSSEASGNITACEKCEENSCNKVYINGSGYNVSLFSLAISTLIGFLVTKL